MLLHVYIRRLKTVKQKIPLIYFHIRSDTKFETRWSDSDHTDRVEAVSTIDSFLRFRKGLQPVFCSGLEEHSSGLNASCCLKKQSNGTLVRQ